MERTVALKKLERLLGKKLWWRINPKAPTPEDRATAKAALPSAIEERNKLKEQRDARHRALLEGDAEYQSLNTAAIAAIARVEKISGITRWYKITVGISHGWANEVKAEGDSWEEVIGKLTTEKVAA
jgi:hypothetical protein